MESIEYKCIICNKKYKTYQTLWKHNKKFHLTTVIDSNINVIENSKNVIENNNYSCKYCNKEFKLRQYRWSHEKNVCQPKHNKVQQEKEENDKKRLELEIIKENNIRLKEEARILNLKLKLQKSEKVDNITLKKLNKLLLERHNRIKNSTVNSHNTINNNQIINNFQLIGFGKEEVTETLTKQDKKLIMNARYNSLDKLIEIIHCGKYNQFKNIIITNMNNNYMYKYDDKVGHFVLSTKTDILNSLIDYRLDDLEIIYNDLLEKNKLDENTKDIIEKFINKINHCESKYTDYEGKEHDNYKQYKINEIKVLLFNNQDKITNDISLLLTANEVCTDLTI
jgi:hypothetical protein